MRAPGNLTTELSADGIQGLPVRLRSAIDSAGGTAEISKKSGIPVSSINDYLNGREPRFSRIFAIAQACGVSLDWLAGKHSIGTSTDKVSEILILSDEFVRAPAHFWGLLVSIQSAREWFRFSGGAPTLLDVLRWIGEPYRSSLALPDRPIMFKEPDIERGPGM
jgi:transcriptional regulator with XRE-family HTH domain